MVFEPTVSNVVSPLGGESSEDEEPGFEVESAVSEEEYQGPEMEPYNPTKRFGELSFPHDRPDEAF